MVLGIRLYAFLFKLIRNINKIIKLRINKYNNIIKNELNGESSLNNIHQYRNNIIEIKRCLI